jgi:hypothetical protein
VNITPEAVTIDRPGELLLASAPEHTTVDEDTVVLPADGAAWWRS